MINLLGEGCNDEGTHLDHCITLNIVLETLELQVKHRRERLEDDALLGVLQTIALRLVLVLAVKCFHSYVVLERLIQVLHTLDIELNV